MKTQISLKNITKEFPNKVVFNNFSLDIEPNKKILIMGSSGSGKTTLLNIIGLLETIDSGETIHFGYKNLKINTRAASRLLREKISYLFQNYALIDSDTVYNNLIIALKYNRTKNKKELIEKALNQVGLSGFQKREIFTLSGGEQQRVALARLIIKPSEIILADEPTGNLDDKNAFEIIRILDYLNSLGKTIIMVSHDHRFEDFFDITINLD